MMTNRELLDAVRRWQADNYPGYPLVSIGLRLHYLPEEIRLVEGPPPLGGQGKPREDEDEHGPSLHPCTEAILDVLAASAHPLPKMLLLKALAERQRSRGEEEWSPRTVDRRLADLMADGSIENPDGAKPQGYRLPPET